MEKREVIPVVRNLLESRYAKGLSHYGKPLEAFGDERDTIMDAVEEAADLLMYLVRIAMEQGSL